MGGALYDNNGTVLAFFREELTAEFISEVKNIIGQVSIIQELEMLALLAAVELWCPLYPSHRVVAFTDSEAVRGDSLSLGPTTPSAATFCHESSKWKMVACARSG